MIEVARGAATDDRLGFVVGTAEQLPWPAASFDLVVSTTAHETAGNSAGNGSGIALGAVAPALRRHYPGSDGYQIAAARPGVPIGVRRCPSSRLLVPIRSSRIGELRVCISGTSSTVIGIPATEWRISRMGSAAPNRTGSDGLDRALSCRQGRASGGWRETHRAVYALCNHELWTEGWRLARLIHHGE